MSTLEEMVTEVLTVGLPAIGHWSTSIPGAPVPTVTVDEDDDGIEYAIDSTLVIEGLLTIVLSDGHGMGLSKRTRSYVRDRFFGRNDHPFDPEEADEILQVALFGQVDWS